jgi:hypothetical protein
MLRKRNGQSTLEYAVLIAIIVGGLITMQIYLKRASMGKLRDAADDLGSQFNPANYTMNLSTTVNGSRTETSTAEGTSTVQWTGETQGRTGDTGFKLPPNEPLWDPAAGP